MICKVLDFPSFSVGPVGEYVITGMCVKTDLTYSVTSTSTHYNTECTYEFCVPQSSEAEYEGKSEIVQQSTTLFLEEKAVVAGTATKPTSISSTYVESLIGIKDFLAKPQIITTGQWLTTDPVPTNLYNFSVADALVGNPIWAEKVKGFALMKGDFVVTVQLNASPFQQGRLLLHYLPCYRDFVAIDPRYGNKYNLNIVQKCQHPHVTIDCQDTAVKLRVPYVAPSHYYSFKNAKYDWGTVFLDVFSALLTGPSAVSTFVDWTLYGHWENVELIGHTYPQSSRKSKVVNRNVVNETAENSGSIASGLKKVGKVAGVLKGVPLISDVAGTVEWASNIASGVASVLGWSKPRELTGQSVMTLQTLRYAGTSDGPDISIPGGIISNNRLETIDYASYTNEDEMSMKYLTQLPVYNGELGWYTTDATDAALYTLAVSPRVFNFSGFNTISTHTQTYEMGGPLYYLSRIFRYWRGGIKMTLKFVKTKMHSGRLLVTWTPGNVVPSVPNINQSSYSMRTIIDIRDDDEVTIELPYLAYSDYLSTANENSGVFQIRVLNQLRGPESVAQAIGIMIFVSGCEDFEFAVPSTTNTAALVYDPQSDTTSKTMHGELGGSELNDSVIGGIPMSEDQLLHSTRCIGEKVLSIKSLLLRNSSLNGYSTFDVGTKNNFVVNPYTVGSYRLNSSTGNIISPRLGGDAYNYLAPMFAFFRGGVRISVLSSAATTNCTKSVVLPGAFTGSVGTEAIYDAIPTFTTNTSFNYNVNAGVSNTQQYLLEPTNRHDTSGVIVQHVPYYNKFPTSLVLTQNVSNQVYTEASQPACAVAFSALPTFTDVSIQRAVCDDFQLSFFIGCPPVPLLYT